MAPSGHGTPYIVSMFVVFLPKMPPTNSGTSYLKTIIKINEKISKTNKLNLYL